MPSGSVGGGQAAEDTAGRHVLWRGGDEGRMSEGNVEWSTLQYGGDGGTVGNIVKGVGWRISAGCNGQCGWHGQSDEK